MICNLTTHLTRLAIGCSGTSIRENYLGDAIKRNSFWYVVDLRLGQLQLTPDEEAKLRGMIEKRVPRPSAESIEAVLKCLAQGLLR